MPRINASTSSSRRWLRRHRRPVAALLAGLGSITAIAALRGSPLTPGSPEAPPASSAVPSSTTLTSLVPVTLAEPGLSAALRAGDVIDLVAVDGPGGGRVVASDARVVIRNSGSSAFTSPSTAVLLVAVAAPDAVGLASIGATTALTAVIREPARSE